MADDFFWYELMTPDLAGALEFYGKVVGWKTVDHVMTTASGGRYVVLEAGARGIGGALELTDEMTAGGAHPGWIGYIHVDDVDARAKAVVAAGGTIFMPPADIPEIGRFAMVADPGGAPFYLMKPLPREGGDPAPLAAGTVGTCGWRELFSTLGDKGAFDFYAAQFGWETVGEFDMGGAMGVYRLFGHDGAQLGGMMKKPDQVPVSVWNFYFLVDGIDAGADRIKTQGGHVVMGPHEVPGGQWIVQGMDPQGAFFALLSDTK